MARASRCGRVRGSVAALAAGLVLAAGCGDSCTPPAPGPDAGPAADAAAGDTALLGSTRIDCKDDLAPDGGPRQAVGGGCLHGNWAQGQDVREFLGIRYARKMGRDRRWTAPERLTAYSGKVDATWFGPSCPQFSFNTLIDDATDTSEDCLTLNVWAPATPPAGGAPVLVFLHGGGFYMGGTHAREIEGPALAARGVVVVTGNYRLGVLGGLAHPDLVGGDGLPQGHFGLQDQAAILAWVRDFAAAFGGDPARVTLAGQSAGGMSVCQHLRRTYDAGSTEERLFHRAVLQSGPCFENLLSASQALEQGRHLARQVGCEKADGTPAQAGRTIPECLRSRSLHDLVHALPMKEGLFWGTGADWTPWFDGRWVPLRAGHPLAALAPGDYQVVLGGVRDEGGLVRFLIQMDENFAHLFDAYSASKYRDWVGRVFGGGDPNAGDAVPVLQKYPANTSWGAATRLRWETVLGLFTFTCPIRRDARALAQGGIPTFLYRFDHAPGFEDLFLGDTAYHTADLPFVFDRTPAWQTFTTAQQGLATAMSGAWARIAAAGAPDPAGTAPASAWPRYDLVRASTGGDPHRRWDLAVVNADEFHPDCDFWDSLASRP